MKRQPDEPAYDAECFIADRDGKFRRYDELTATWVEYERKPFWRFLLDRWRDDWNRNSRAVMVAICVCIAAGLLTASLKLLP